MSKCEDMRRVHGPSLQEKHRAYLASLQERNQACRQLREADEQCKEQQMKREQGFSLCFSGANRTRKGPARRHSAGSVRSDSPVCRGYGTPGRACEDVSALGRRWEEHTVEILGLDGEVYGVRPTGERVAELSPSCLEAFGDDSYEFWAAAASPILTESPSPAAVQPESEQQASSASQCKSPPFAAASAAREQALALLRLQRCTATSGISFTEGLAAESGDGCFDYVTEGETAETLLHDATTAAPREASEDEGTAEEADEEDASAVPPLALDLTMSPADRTELELADEPAVLAERITKLPGRWRASLLRHLEEAEADVAASDFAAAIAAATALPLRSPATTPSCGRRPSSSGGYDTMRRCGSSGASTKAMEESPGLSSGMSPPMF